MRCYTYFTPRSSRLPSLHATGLCVFPVQLSDIVPYDGELMENIEGLPTFQRFEKQRRVLAVKEESVAI